MQPQQHKKVMIDIKTAEIMIKKNIVKRTSSYSISAEWGPEWDL